MAQDPLLDSVHAWLCKNRNIKHLPVTRHTGRVTAYKPFGRFYIFPFWYTGDLCDAFVSHTGRVVACKVFGQFDITPFWISGYIRGAFLSLVPLSLKAKVVPHIFLFQLGRVGCEKAWGLS